MNKYIVLQLTRNWSNWLSFLSNIEEDHWNALWPACRTKDKNECVIFNTCKLIKCWCTTINYDNTLSTIDNQSWSLSHLAYTRIVPRTGGTCLRSDYLDRASGSMSLKHFQLFGLFCLLFAAVCEVSGASVYYL